MDLIDQSGPPQSPRKSPDESGVPLPAPRPLPPPQVAPYSNGFPNTLADLGRWFQRLPTVAQVGLILVSVMIAVGVWGAVSTADDSSSRSSSRPASASCEDVSYIIRGNAKRVSITMENASGNTEQHDPVSVPYNKGLGCLPSGQFLYLSAQNNDEHGTVICEIKRNGRIVATSTSSGAYVIASCSD